VKDFTRDRKLPFFQLIIWILSIVTSGKHCGVATKIGSFIKNAKQGKLWPKVKCFDQSSLCKRRQKVSWKLFDWLFTQAVTMVYSVWEDQEFPKIFHKR